MDDKATAPSTLRAIEAERHIAVLENRIDARDLFGGRREILIAHNEDLYRLRLTSQNKLILTK